MMEKILPLLLIYSLTVIALAGPWLITSIKIRYRKWRRKQATKRK